MKVQLRGRALFQPLVDWMARQGVHPNVLTVAGLFLMLLPTWLIVQGHFFWGAIALSAVITTDFLDGQLARTSGKTTKFGAFLDSTLDRISEFLLIGGYLLYFRGDPRTQVWLYLFLLCSILVSYVRARGEGLGVSVQVGPMNRPGRLFTLVVLTLLGPKVFALLLPYVTFLVAFTVVRRSTELYNSLKNR